MRRSFERGSRVCSKRTTSRSSPRSVTPTTFSLESDDLRPDVAVVDIRMPPTHTDEGLRAAREIRSRYPGDRRSRPVAAPRGRVRVATRRREAGRVGYLMKERVGRVEELIDALQRVAAGECVVDRAVVDELLARRRQVDPIDELTPREREVLALIAEGRSIKASAGPSGSARRRWRHTSRRLREARNQERHPKTIGACSPCSPTSGARTTRGEFRGGGKRTCMWLSWLGYGITTPLGPCSPGRVADEDHLRAGADEAVEQILGEPVVDLADRDRGAQEMVAPRVEILTSKPF